MMRGRERRDDSGEDLAGRACVTFAPMSLAAMHPRHDKVSWLVRRVLGAVLVFTVVAAAACGGGGGGGDLRACMALAVGQCTQEERCLAARYEPELCLATATERCEQMFRGHGSGWSDDQLIACGQTLQTTTDCRHWSSVCPMPRGSLPGKAACSWGGQCQSKICQLCRCAIPKALGDECDIGALCPEGLVCGHEGAAPAPLTCMVPRALGEPCDYSECDAGLGCKDGRCAPPAALGEECGGSLGCAEGYCSHSKPERCEPIPDEGEDCSKSLVCREGLVCTDVGGAATCRRPSAPAAGGYGVCPAGYFYWDGACRVAAKPGQPCSQEAQCLGGLACLDDCVSCTGSDTRTCQLLECPN